MKKSFRLEGLCCANCGAKIERAVNDLPGVASATLNFMTTKLTIDVADEHMSSVVEKLSAIVNKYEPDVVVKRA